MPGATASTGTAASLRRWLRDWALRRQGPDTLPRRLSARRVYILPTAAGWTFALLLGVMFVAGMNYGNGLALLFTFWLAGFALVAMVQTQRRLTGTTVQAASAQAAHAGGQVRLRLQVSGRSLPQDLRLTAEGPEPAASALPSRATSLADDGSLWLDLPAPRRGRWRAPALRLATTAPFGLFEAWSWLSPAVTTVVYPAALGRLPVPETTGAAAGSSRHEHGLDELAWLRDFRDGDSPRQVAWKAYARGQPLLVREYQGEGALRHDFDFDALRGLEVEARLSQLARWVVDADTQGRSWVLRLPGAPPLPGSGTDHRVLCLTRLALHGIEAPP